MKHTFWTFLVAMLVLLQLPNAAMGQERFNFPSSSPSQELVIDAVGDIVAVEPLIRDFQSLHPDIAVTYYDSLTNQLFERLESACDTSGEIADIVFSSSVDHMIKLANDGCAQAVENIETAKLPAHARWHNEVFGFTFEPAVLVYNTRLLPKGMPVPHTRDEFVSLLRERESELLRRVGIYNIATSGVGYLFAYHDAQNSSTSSRLLESFGRTQAALFCCSGALLRDIENGKLLFGYNVLGSYAYGRMKAGSPIGIVLLEDYTLALSRAVFIPKRARNSTGARKFLDYLLSARGQSVLARESFYFPVNRALPSGIEEPPGYANSGLLRPISLTPALLAVTDKQNIARMLADWNRIFGQGTISP